MRGEEARRREEGGVPFWKMSGSGNDFIVIDNRAGVLAAAEQAGFARRVCDRRRSLGADGIVLIDDPLAAGDEVHFRWTYINADGSEGELCGNGAMCGARFAFLHGIAPARCRFQTPSGVVAAEIVEPEAPHSQQVRIAIADPGPLLSVVGVEVRGRDLAPQPIVVGVPHVVVVADDVDGFADAAEFLQIGRAIRHHPAFAPAGTNLDVIDVVDGQTLRMRTYERGVEDETLACGTGAVASAIVATARGLVAPPVTAITRGGLPLIVDFDLRDGQATDVTLTGQARVVASGELWAE
jgi:diaminopimelate epimerase